MSKGELTTREMAVTYEREFLISMHFTTMQKYWTVMEGTTKSSYIKPLLSIQQRINRLDFVLGKLVHEGHGVYVFDKMLHTIHVDEKWVFVWITST